MIGISKGLKDLLTAPNNRQEVTSSSSNKDMVSPQKRMRQLLTLPLSIIGNALFLVVTILEIKDDIIGGPIIRFTSIKQRIETPLLFMAFATFGLVLLVDLFFIIMAIYQEGRTKLSVLSGSLVHHCGFLVWIMQLLLGYIPYSTGVGYCLFLLEFAFPLRIIQSMVSDGKSSSNETSHIKAKAMVFGLDMFCSGGGTFAAILFYIATLASANADIYWRIFWTYLLAIIYWFVQLLTFHRWSLERMLHQAGLQNTHSIRRDVTSHSDLNSEEIIFEEV